MTDETQLRLQIQEEIDREAIEEKRINNSVKRFFKMFKQYKLVNSVEQSDVVLIFDKTDPEYFNILLTDDGVKSFLTNNPKPSFVLVYVKNKNKHNAKLRVFSDVLKKRFLKS